MYEEYLLPNLVIGVSLSPTQSSTLRIPGLSAPQSLSPLLSLVISQTYFSFYKFYLLKPCNM